MQPTLIQLEHLHAVQREKESPRHPTVTRDGRRGRLAVVLARMAWRIDCEAAARAVLDPRPLVGRRP